MTIISNIGADLKNYRLQIINLWEDGEDCPLLDNPKDGDMVSYRSVGADGLPVVEDVKVYQNGEWVEQGGGADIDNPYALLYDGTITAGKHTWQSIPVTMDIVSPLLFPNIDVNYPSTVDVKFQGVLYQNIPIKTDEVLELVYYGATLDNTTFTFNWSEYPFAFVFNPSEELIMFCTENVGEYAAKIGSSDYMACVPTGYRTLNYNDTYFTSRYKYVLVNVT